MIGIYKIENKRNGMIYIGQSINIEKRWGEHIRKLQNNSHVSVKMQEDFNTGGIEDFTFTIIEVVDNEDEINDVEYKWIEYYKAYNDYNTVHRLSLRDDYDGGNIKYKKEYEYVDLRLVKNMNINFDRFDNDENISNYEYELLLILYNIAIKNQNEIVNTSYRALIKAMGIKITGSGNLECIKNAIYNICNKKVYIDNCEYELIEDIIYNPKDNNSTLKIILNSEFIRNSCNIIKYKNKERNTLVNSIGRFIYMIIKSKYKLKTIKITNQDIINKFLLKKDKYYVKRRFITALQEMIDCKIIRKFEIKEDCIIIERL